MPPPSLPRAGVGGRQGRGLALVPGPRAITNQVHPQAERTPGICCSSDAQGGRRHPRRLLSSQEGHQPRPGHDQEEGRSLGSRCAHHPRAPLTGSDTGGRPYRAACPVGHWRAQWRRGRPALGASARPFAASSACGSSCHPLPLPAGWWRQGLPARPVLEGAPVRPL